MSYEDDGYVEGDRYVCSVGCGGEVTIVTNGSGNLTCCGQSMTKVEPAGAGV